MESGGKKVGTGEQGALTSVRVPFACCCARTCAHPPSSLPQVNENKALSKKKQWAPYSSKCTVGAAPLQLLPCKHTWHGVWGRVHSPGAMRHQAFSAPYIYIAQACKTSIAKDYKYCQGCSYQKGLCAM